MRSCDNKAERKRIEQVQYVHTGGFATCKYCLQKADLTYDGEVSCGSDWHDSVAYYCFVDECPVCKVILVNGQMCVEHRRRGQCGC